MRKEISTRVGALALSLSISFADASAEQPPKLLAKGLSAEMVRKTWGPPADVHERETSRRVVWNYQNGASVTLGNGKVVDFQMPKSYVPPPEPVVETTETSRDESADASLTRDLVREIAKEIPSGPDSPFSGASDVPVEPAASAPQPQAVQPFSGQANQGVFQGLPNQQRGAFYVPEESDE